MAFPPATKGLLALLLGAVPLLALLAPASAQATPGTLYFTNTVIDDPGGPGTKVFAASEVLPVAEGKAAAPVSPGPVTYTTAWDYTLPAAATLSGLAHVDAYVSCETLSAYRAGVAGQLASSRAILLKGTTAIAQADRADQFTPCTGPASINQLSFDVDTKGTAFAAGDLLEVQVLVWWTNSGGVDASPAPSTPPDAYFLVGGAAHTSKLTVAGLVGGAAAGTGTVRVHGNLTGATASLEQSFATSRNATYLYNWTQGPAAATIRLTVHGTGNATVTIRDASRAVVFTASPRNTTSYLNVTAKQGTWSVEVNYTVFKGDLALSITPRTTAVCIDACQTGSGTASTSRSGSTGGSGTQGSTTSKGTPAVGALLLLAGMGLVAGLRRRHA
ncbi:MAG TPA: hypothetical protein VM286_08380 [Candidatus Thermoplasmatota archaeon]|nr:hypothetical protein [Candidatus Thermoplasmatota archaeon]